jgi:serine/threonine protein kinase
MSIINENAAHKRLIQSRPMTESRMTDRGADAPDKMTGRTPQPGMLVGRYKIISLLGEGAIGTVFCVRDEVTQRLVALKLIDKATPRYRVLGAESFLREARAVAVLDHPNIIKLYDVGETDEYSYIAMELLHGGDIWRLFRKQGAFSFKRVTKIGAEVAEALTYAHSRGIIHRDLKPANLILSRSGRCKLSDFGFARGADPTDDFDLAPQKIGTKFYLAPEVLEGQAAGPAADVYGLAVSLWIVLVGKSPFAAKTVVEIARAKREDPLPDLRVLRPDLPAEFVIIMERALEREPGHRMSMDEFAQRLRSFSPAPPSGGDSLAGFSTGIPLTDELRAELVKTKVNKSSPGKMAEAPRTAPPPATPPAPNADIEASKNGLMKMVANLFWGSY